jgi:hypothetical protein
MIDVAVLDRALCGARRSTLASLWRTRCRPYKLQTTVCPLYEGKRCNNRASFHVAVAQYAPDEKLESLVAYVHHRVKKAACRPLEP